MINLADALAELEEARYLDVDQRVANALFKVGSARLERGRLAEADEALDEAEHLCRKLDNPAGLAQVQLRRARVDLARGTPEAAESRLRAALAFFREAGEPGRVAGALESLAEALAATGRGEEALAGLEEALALTREGDDLVGEAVLLGRQASLLRTLGRWEPAKEAYFRLGRLAEALGDQERTALACVGVGACLCGGGRLTEGLARLAQARDLYQRLGQAARAEQLMAEMARLAGGAPGESQP